MTLVDASAIAKLVLNEEGHDKAAALFEKQLSLGKRVMTVNLALPESLNAIWKHHVLKKELSEAEFDGAVSDAIKIFNRLEKINDQKIAKYASSLAARNRMSVYDAFYLAGSITESAPLLTFDGPLREKAERIGVVVLR